MMETLTVDQAAAKLGVSTKTIRRWIDSGKLPATETKGPRGMQWSISCDDVQTVKNAPKPQATPKPATAPNRLDHDDLNGLTQAIRDLTKKVETMEAELRDARHQLHQFQEATIKALPAPKKSLLDWLKRK